MNEHSDADLGDDADHGPVDNDGRPIDPPVLSMEGLREEQQNPTLIVRNADLYLLPSDGVSQTGAAAGSSDGIGGPAHGSGSNLGMSGMTVMPKGWSLDGNIVRPITAKETPCSMSVRAAIGRGICPASTSSSVLSISRRMP